VDGPPIFAPKRISVVGIDGKESVVSSAACGHYHSLLVDKDGRVFSAGRATDGQLGLGSRHNVCRFTQVTKGVLSRRRVVAVSAGELHSLALLDDGAVAAWGWEADGRLGRGTTTFDVLDENQDGFPSDIPGWVKMDAPVVEVR